MLRVRRASVLTHVKNVANTCSEAALCGGAQSDRRTSCSNRGTAAARRGYPVRRRCRRDHLTGCHQPGFDELFLRDRLVSVAADLERSAIRVAAHGAAAAHADVSTEPVLDRLAGDPHAVGLRGIGLECSFVDFLRFEHGLDFQWSQHDGQFPHRRFELATGIPATGASLAALDEALPRNLHRLHTIHAARVRDGRS